MVDKGTALICGGGKDVFAEIDAAKQLFVPEITIAINDICEFVAEAQHIATMHPERMTRWLWLREKRGYPRPILWTAAHRKGRYRDEGQEEALNFQTVEAKNGSSGFLAVKVAFHLGMNRVVLAGIPMTAEQGHFYKPEKPWTEFYMYQQAWKEEKSFNEVVKSMSGWTKELLGAPTKEWFC